MSVIWVGDGLGWNGVKCNGIDVGLSWVGMRWYGIRLCQGGSRVGLCRLGWGDGGLGWTCVRVV